MLVLPVVSATCWGRTTQPMVAPGTGVPSAPLTTLPVTGIEMPDDGDGPVVPPVEVPPVEVPPPADPVPFEPDDPPAGSPPPPPPPQAASHATSTMTEIRCSEIMFFTPSTAWRSGWRRATAPRSDGRV
ncbi:MAG TPA: hypothetical protein PKA20_01155 [Burkholderiaceae bacterium]|nr:hypothetical protein [Burkholderiaceae bacterium]